MLHKTYLLKMFVSPPPYSVLSVTSALCWVLLPVKNTKRKWLQKNNLLCQLWFDFLQFYENLFVAVEGLQPPNVQSKYGWIQGSELVDVYETLYKAGLGIC